MNKRVFIYYAKNGLNKELHEIIPEKIYQCDDNNNFYFLIGKELNSIIDEVFIIYKNNNNFINIRHEQMSFKDKIHEVSIDEMLEQDNTIINTSKVLDEKTIINAIHRPKEIFIPEMEYVYIEEKPVIEDQVEDEVEIEEQDDKITNAEKELDEIIEILDDYEEDIEKEDKKTKSEEDLDKIIDEIDSDLENNIPIKQEEKKKIVITPPTPRIEDKVTDAEKELDEIIEEDENTESDSNSIEKIDDIINNIFGKVSNDDTPLDNMTIRKEEIPSDLEKINLDDYTKTIAIVFATIDTTKVGFFTYENEEDSSNEKFGDEQADVKKIYNILTLDLDKEFDMSKDEFKNNIENRKNAYTFDDKKGNKYYVKTFIYHYMYQTVLSLETFSSGTNLITDKYSEITENGNYKTIDNGFECSFDGFETYILTRKQ